MINNYKIYSLTALKREYEKSLARKGTEMLQTDHRDKAQAWLIDKFPHLSCSMNSRMLACLYFDIALRIKPEKGILELLGIVCFSIALKFEHNTSISLSTIEESVSMEIGRERLVSAEKFILMCLNYKLCRSTPSYIIRLILDVTLEGDNNELAAKADVIALVGLINTIVANEGPFKVAVASISLSLMLLKFNQIFEEWWNELKRYVDVSRDEIHIIELNLLVLIT